MSRDYVHPTLAETMFAAATKTSGDDNNTTKMTLEKFKQLFCPNVDAFVGKRLVTLEYSFYNGGSYESYELVSTEELEKVEKADARFHLGEVDGKHSDVYLRFSDMVDTVVEDPYDIYQLLRTIKRSSSSYISEWCDQHDNDEDAASQDKNDDGASQEENEEKDENSDEDDHEGTVGRKRAL
jgi:hypothetical protein